MSLVTKSPVDVFDLVRGLAAYTGSPLLKAIGRVIAKHPGADIGNAFNHKQVACKMWARDRLLESLGGRFQRVWILGGWYGVLAAMFFDDARFDIDLIESIDIDPDVEAVAHTLVGEAAGRFRALTGDMYRLDYKAAQPDLVINTSCEHIADLKGWLALLPPHAACLCHRSEGRKTSSGSDAQQRREWISRRMEGQRAW